MKRLVDDMAVRRLFITLAAASAVAGCARYAPDPLAGAGEAVLSGPSPAGLVGEAAGLRHPRLKPVAIDLARPLSPDALAVLAVLANPDLKAARAKAGITDAQAFSAGLLPDPVLNLAFDQRLSGPDPFNAWAAQLSYDLLSFRNRRVQLEGERASVRQVRLDLAWQEWQTAEQAKLLAARIAGLGRASALADESRGSAESILARVLAAAARGDERADEVETRRLAVADAADKARQAGRDLAAARRDLNKLLGLPPATVLTLAYAPPPSAPTDAAALFARARAERLDLRALEAGYDSQEAAVRKAVLDQFPALQLTLNRAQDTAHNNTVGPAVNFTLPLWNRNRGGIAVAQATRAQLKAEYAARLFTARADIAAFVAGIAVARRQRGEIAAQVGPYAKLVDATEAAAWRGDVAPVLAETARQTLRDRRAALGALDQSIAEQAIGLELAVGAPLETGA